MFSELLTGKIQERLKKKEQVILFLNRRGYSGFVTCRSCGHVMKCPHCDVSLTSHRNGRLICHYCGYETMDVQKCPVCGSPYIGGFRAGTQQIESLVTEKFSRSKGPADGMQILPEKKMIMRKSFPLSEEERQTCS